MKPKHTLCKQTKTHLLYSFSNPSHILCISSPLAATRVLFDQLVFTRSTSTNPTRNVENINFILEKKKCQCKSSRLKLVRVNTARQNPKKKRDKEAKEEVKGIGK